MKNQLPDPKTIVDSIADGAVELAEGPVRVAENIAGVAGTFASQIKANMDDLKTKMPDDLSVIPDVLIKSAGQTVNAGISLFQGIGRGVMDTGEAVKRQIQRVTG